MKRKEISTKQLKVKAIKVFNAWIRKRDEGQPCISCGKFTSLQAGHFYSAGSFSLLRFNEDNVNGQCLRCNYFLSGNLIEYRKNLLLKIGQERLDKLDMLSKVKTPIKNNKFLYLDIINKYKL